MQTKELMLQAEKNRKRLVEIVQIAKAGHIGGGLSSMNMLTALYFKVMNLDPKNPKWEERDRFVMSKGHCVEALYSVLEHRGFITKELTDTYGQFDTPLAGHPTIEVPGIEVNSGALGHGLPIGVGMAIAAKMDKKAWRTYVLMGDGEQGEGSIYEAAMAGSHYKLDNLTVIFDWNGLQIDGRNDDVMSLGDFKGKLTAFGLDLIEVMDGNDIEQIIAALDTPVCPGKPRGLLCHTVKGKGVSFMENNAGWHGKAPNSEETAIALKELEG